MTQRRRKVQRAEVVVIGGGPAGLLAAREAARRGVEVEILEEHPQVGEPNHCAGLLSVEGLRRLGVEPSPDFVQNTISGLRLHAPGGACIEVEGGRGRAFAVDRAALDRHLADAAEREGAALRTGRRAEGLLHRAGWVEGVRGRGWEVEAQVVIDAEGGGRTLSGGLLPDTNPVGALAGVNAEVSGVEVDPDVAEVWLGGLAPGLFSWVIPLGDGEARCGLACSAGGAAERLRRFVDRRFPGARPRDVRGGVVLTGGPAGRTYGDGLLLVGDVAGQTKPTTGGGVVLGGLCARAAGSTAAEAVEAGDFSAGFLRRYQASWRRSLGGEFAAMLAARKLLNRLSDEQIDRLFVAFRREGLQEVLQGLVEGGDMDMQGGFVRSVLREPRLMGLLARGVGLLALSELRGLFKI